MTIPVIPEEWPEFCEFTDLLYELSRAKTFFNDLFIANPKTLVDMERTAPSFFRSMSFALRTQILLRLASLFDPAITGKNRNITIRSILHQSQIWLTPDTLKECYEIMDRNADAVGQLKLFRDKVLAHNDFGMRVGDKQFPTLNMSNLDDIFTCLTQITATIEFSLFNCHTNYDHIYGNASDEILRVLDAYLCLENLRDEKCSLKFSDSDVGAYVKKHAPRRGWVDDCLKYDKNLSGGGFMLTPPTDMS